MLAGGIERLNFASAGFLEKAPDATTQFAPIIRTTADAMQIPADSVSMMPDAVGLLRNYKRGGKPLVLAARISGDAKSAFPDGRRRPPAPAPDAKIGSRQGPGQGAGKARPSAPSRQKATGSREEDRDAAAPARPKQVTAGKINVVVVADSDFLNDQFWVEVREFLGQQVAIPNAHNGAFVLGALENLSGSDALISLRGRGISDRPFELVAELRRDAEERFRNKEQVLTARLREVQTKLAGLEKQGDGENLVLTDKDRQEIEKFRGDMLSVRRELREVKRELRKDIDRLDGVLKFANIAAVPLLIGFAGIGWAAYRRRRTSRPAAANADLLGVAAMTPRNFVYLAIAAALSVLFAVVSFASNNQWSTGKAAGDKLFPTLASDASQIATIEVRQGDNTVVLERDGRQLGPQESRQLSGRSLQGAHAAGRPRRGRAHREQDAQARPVRGARAGRPRRQGRQVAARAPPGRQGQRHRRGRDRQEAPGPARHRQVRHLRAQAGRSADLARQRRAGCVRRGEGLAQDLGVHDRCRQDQPRHHRDSRRAAVAHRAPGAAAAKDARTPSSRVPDPAAGKLQFVGFPPADKKLKDAARGREHRARARSIDMEDVRKLDAPPAGAGVSTVKIEAADGPTTTLRLRKDGDAHWLSHRRHGRGRGQEGGGRDQPAHAGLGVQDSRLQGRRRS